MATAAKVTYPHVVKEPAYCGGKAAIDDTRVRVTNVVHLHNPDEIEETLEAEEGWDDRYERRRAVVATVPGNRR